MPQKRSPISQFWQELKRRNVTRVLAVYIAAAFMILELVDMISVPFGLPGWSLRVAFFILLAGLVLAVIVSWIYDVHPEDGIIKSEPTEKVPEELVPQSYNGWKIASYISFVVIAALILLNVFGNQDGVRINESLEKSVAVLPFDYLGSDEENSHIGRAFTDEIIMELQKIKAFDRVLSYTSTLQYEEQRPTIPEIGEKLNVNYIIEGTIQQQGNNVSINVQVIIAKDDDHIWAKEFNGLWQDIYSIQDEIAFKVASELNIVLSPEEKDRVEIIPTYNPLAHEFYQRGRDQFFKWRSEFSQEALEKGGEFFRKAIELDRTFAPAYTGLAWIYYSSKSYRDMFSENYLDSLIMLADTALFYDKQLAEAHTIKGLYYWERGQREKAIVEFDMAIVLNPNEWMAYEQKAIHYYNRDMVKSLYNYHKAVELNRGEGLSYMFSIIHLLYTTLGMEEKAEYYAQQILELGDSAKYYSSLAFKEESIRNYEGASEYYKRANAIKSLIIDNVALGYYALMLRQFDEAYTYFRPFMEEAEEIGRSEGLLFYYGAYGYLLWEKGYPKQAEKYFDRAIESWSKILELGGSGFFDSQSAHTELAKVYAFRGEKEKAFKHLEQFNQRKWMMITDLALLKDSPLFDNIRDEPEFQQIVRDVEAKYQAEHDRVRQWLEENDML